MFVGLFVQLIECLKSVENTNQILIVLNQLFQVKISPLLQKKDKDSGTLPTWSYRLLAFTNEYSWIQHCRWCIKRVHAHISCLSGCFPYWSSFYLTLGNPKKRQEKKVATFGCNSWPSYILCIHIRFYAG